MSIYTPYFYIIQDVRNGMYYAGSKYGIDANPENFMVEGGYQTSSKTVKRIISLQGLDAFVVRKIKTFTTAYETTKYEKRFLEKVNARKNSNFYNCHNNDGLMDINKMQQISMLLYGVDHILKSPQVRQAIRETMIARYGVPYYLQTTECKERRKNTMLLKYENESYIKSETHKIRNLLKYGVEYAFQAEEIKDKIREAIKKKYGEMYFTQTTLFKETKRVTSQKIYGCDHPSQNLNVKNKRKSTNIQKYGTDEIFKSDHFKKKRKETCLELFGAESYVQSTDARLKRSKMNSGKGNPRYGTRYTLEDKKKIFAHTQRPLIINGVRYLFPFEAAEILQLDSKEIRKRLNSKKDLYRDWYYEDVGMHIPTEHGNRGKKKQHLSDLNKSRAYSFFICGMSYQSVKEAATAMKVNAETVRRRSKSDKYPDWICIKGK